MFVIDLELHIIICFVGALQLALSIGSNPLNGKISVHYIFYITYNLTLVNQYKQHIGLGD